MVRLFFISVGYFFTLVGSTYIIGYLNLLNMGYNLDDYVNFITRRGECWLFVIGLITLIITIVSRKDD